MNPHALVIGAGALGLSTAIELRRRRVGVTVIDQGRKAGTSSWAGAGILSPLPPWGYGEPVSRLALAGMRAWPEWAAELDALSRTSAEFWTCGMEVRGSDALEPALDWCLAHHLPAEFQPLGIWLPTISQARNPRLLVAMKEALQSLGGSLLPECEVSRFHIRKGRIASLETSRGALTADLFVLATGAWSGQPLGEVLPVPNIRPMRGQMLLYAPGSHDLEHIILDNGFYLVPRKDGHLLAGSTVEDAGFEPVTTADALSALHRQACRLLPSLEHHQPIQSWAGLRPGSPDNVPVIARHPEVENLWVQTGHFRYGVTMAPASSRLLAELMTGEQPFLEPAPYSWQAALKRTWE